MIGPRSFFDELATFEPYNQHLIQDIGAFQIGLGAVLVLAALRDLRDPLVVGLVGVGVGMVAHVVSHAVGHDLGGTPEVDIPVFSGARWSVARRRPRPLEAEPLDVASGEVVPGGVGGVIHR